MTDDALAFLSATKMAAAIRERRLSPLDATRALLERIEDVDPRLNAFLTVCGERALEEARRAEQAVMNGEKLGPLHGVPFSVKDLLNTEGVRTTFGSHAFAEHVPGHDVAAVARLRTAGAILIGKTTTPEFGHKPLTEAPLFGRTSNPWSSKHSSGGSSGGAAAAVASGLAPLALGTDGGGSIRIPAAACGIVGVKATLGLVPHDQTPDSFGVLAYIGPMTRTVADAALMLSVIAGPHPDDPHTLGRTAPNFGPVISGAAELPPPCRTGTQPNSAVKIGYCRFLGNAEIDRETAELVDGAVASLADLGAQIEPLETNLPSTLTVWGPLTFSIWAQRFQAVEAAIGDQMSASLRHWMAEGRKITGTAVQAGMEARTQIFRTVQKWFDDYDWVVMPTLSAPAIAIDHDPRGEIVLNGAPAGGLREGWYPYTHPFNLTGHPAITVPAGWTRAGLPVGMQLVGPYFGDRDLLGLAQAFEAAHPWQDRVPSFGVPYPRPPS